MCPCNLSHHHVCDACTQEIEGMLRKLGEAVAKGWDSQRYWRGRLETLGLKADIVAQQIKAKGRTA